MSKEREEAYRAMNKATEEYIAETAPLVKNVNENVLSAIWKSDSRVLSNGKWYVSISDVSNILQGKKTVDKCCGQGCCDHEEPEVESTYCSTIRPLRVNQRATE